MIRALIVDDEPLARERVRTLLAACPDVEVVGEAADGPAALTLSDETTPDVVFLDVQMPGLSGLDVAAEWHRHETRRMPVIVFVTAFDQYAVDAFRLHAVDYLTKPIDADRFADAVDRVRAVLRGPDRGDLDRRLEAMLEMHERRQSIRPHLVVREQDRYLLVPTSEVHCLEATGNYVRLHCERGGVPDPQHVVGGGSAARSRTVPPDAPFLDRESRLRARSAAVVQRRMDSPHAPRVQGARRPAVPRGRLGDPSLNTGARP